MQLPSIQLGVWGCCKPSSRFRVVKPLEAGGSEAPGSSEKFVFYSTKKRPKNICVVHFFSALNTIIKKLSDTIDSLI